MPSILATILTGAASDLRQADARFAVVGGLAVAARAVLRFTQDVDLAVAVADDDEAERVAGVLIRYGYRPLMELDQKAVGRLATLRLLSPHAEAGLDPTDAPLLDIIFASAGIEPEVVDAATPIAVLDDLTLLTARIPHLVAMKLVSESERRFNDRADLLALITAATDDDLREVPPLLALIESRGFAQDKDLSAGFARFRQLAER